MANSSTRVALIQMSCEASTEANLKKAVARVREAAGVKLPLVEIFRHSTLEGFARVVEAAAGEEKAAAGRQHRRPLLKIGQGTRQRCLPVSGSIASTCPIGSPLDGMLRFSTNW